MEPAKYFGTVVEYRWHMSASFRRITLSSDGVVIPGGLFRPTRKAGWEQLESVTLERTANLLNRRQIVWFTGTTDGNKWRVGFIPSKLDQLLDALNSFGASVDLEPATGQRSVVSDVLSWLARPQGVALALIVVGANAYVVVRRATQEAEPGDIIQAAVLAFAAVFIIANALGLLGKRF